MPTWIMCSIGVVILIIVGIAFGRPGPDGSWSSICASQEYLPPPIASPRTANSGSSADKASASPSAVAIASPTPPETASTVPVIGKEQLQQDIINFYNYSRCLAGFNFGFDVTVKGAAICATILTTYASVKKNVKLGVISGALAIALSTIQATFPTGERAVLHRSVVAKSDALMSDHYYEAEPDLPRVRATFQALKLEAAGELASRPLPTLLPGVTWGSMPTPTATATASTATPTPTATLTPTPATVP
jgi:hypothetical protein